MAKSFPNTGATVIDATADLPGSPSEGMIVFQKDTNELKIYDGSAWVSVLDTDTPPGLVYLNSYTLSGTTTSFQGCFNSSYTNYLILFDNVMLSSGDTIDFQMMSGATSIGTSNYYSQRLYVQGATAGGTPVRTNAAFGSLIYCAAYSATDSQGFQVMISNPFEARPTNLNIFGNYNSSAGPTYYLDGWASAHTVSTAYDGIRIYSNNGYTLTGTATLYGYRKTI
jgi:hypothetical protein